MFLRFGKPEIKNHWSLFIEIPLVICWFFTVYFCELPLLLYLFPVCYLIFTLSLNFFNYLEKFRINDKKIDIVKLGLKKTVDIPNEIVLIVSEAQLLTFDEQMPILKNKYSVSILSSMELNIALEQIHGTDWKIIRYTNKTIEETFKHEFVYSFVLTEETCNILNTLNCKYTIIPKSISNIIKFGENVYIDEEY